MEGKSKLKRFEIFIDPDLDNSTGVDKISLVSEPAIEINWKAFTKQAEKYKFQQDSKDKHILVGPAMVPDMDIFRNDESGEYNVFFSAETIDLIVKKFHRNGNPKFSINVEHSDQNVDAYLVSDWIVEDPSDSINMGFNVPKGTWMVKVYVEDQNFWNQFIKTGYVKGFSVEGMMKQIEVAMKKVNMAEQTIDRPDDGPNTPTNTIVHHSTGEFPTKAAKIHTVPVGRAFAPGIPVGTHDENMAAVPVPDGVHTMSDGSQLHTKDSIIKKVIPSTPATVGPDNSTAPENKPAEAEKKFDNAPMADNSKWIGKYTEEQKQHLASMTWEECQAEVGKEYDDPEVVNKVCGAIKAGTINHSKMNKQSEINELKAQLASLLKKFDAYGEKEITYADKISKPGADKAWMESCKTQHLVQLGIADASEICAEIASGKVNNPFIENPEDATTKEANVKFDPVQLSKHIKTLNTKFKAFEAEGEGEGEGEGDTSDASIQDVVQAIQSLNDRVAALEKGEIGEDDGKEGETAEEMQDEMEYKRVNQFKKTNALASKPLSEKKDLIEQVRKAVSKNEEFSSLNKGYLSTLESGHYVSPVKRFFKK